ncbi:hypothetical protein CBS101457_003783 [Exobasidium rhododendri]|nr:hypothetical protein CBS101457_003783 [Exobasidium rhododendri]
MQENKVKGGEIPTIVSIDPHKDIVGQKKCHNRWHHEIPFVASLSPLDVFKVETHEWTGGQIKNTDDADDIKNVDLTRIHNLSGPFEIKGASPGDVLVVDILDVTPFPHCTWGFTGIFELENGGGLFAKDLNSKACKAIWDFQGIYATSRHIPGVRFAGIPHPGLIGTMPSKELLETWNKREGGLIAKHGDCVPAVALPPNPVGAYVGQDLPDDVRERIYREGCRTIPGREHGGNCDIKNLSRGSRCFFPVFVEGAGLSLGDLHFSQGDGELSFCGAIEMAGITTLKVDVIKGGMEKFAMTMPIFLPSPIDPIYAEKLVFEGIGVDLHNGTGEQGNMDATMAFKTAARNTIAFLGKLGYTVEQSILLLSAAPVDAHVAAIVDSPNACVTMALPVAIFERDIRPHPDGYEKKDYGQCAIRSDGVV